LREDDDCKFGSHPSESTCNVELLQTNVLKQEFRASKACSCIPWADVYKTYDVSCGQGLELFSWIISTNMTALSASDPLLYALKSKLGRIYCEHFFEKFSMNFCVNEKFMVTPNEADKWYSGQWCYVSSECTQLHGGGHLPGTRANWKVCQAGKDKLLRDMAPAHLFDLARELNVDAGFMTGMSYFYDDKDPARMLPDELREIGQSGRKVVLWSSKAYTKSRVLIAGKEQWALGFNHTAGMLGRAGEFWSTACHGGCSLLQKDAVEEKTAYITSTGNRIVPDAAGEAWY